MDVVNQGMSLWLLLNRSKCERDARACSGWGEVINSSGGVGDFKPAVQ